MVSTLRSSQLDQEVTDALGRGEARLALGLCVREHGVAVGRLCMALVGSRVEADDLVQETFLAVHEALPEWRREGTLRAWIFGIARNKCAHFLEKRRRREGRLRLIVGGGEDDSEELVLRRERASRARAALSQVRPSEREALLLRYVAQLSYEEVGGACGVDAAAARKRVSRALSHLRASLEKTE